MKVAVMANGEWDSSWGQNELADTQLELFICADGGGNLAIASGKVPDVLIGDMDSITAENLKKCQEGNTEIKTFPKEKNQTDLELAVEYAEKTLQSYGNPEDEILLYAAGGKRLDHLLGNVALLLAYAEKGRRIKMRDKISDAWIMLRGKDRVCGSKGQELSIIPLSEKAEVTSNGLYYELSNLSLSQNSPKGISNVFTCEEIVLEVHEGKVLIVLLKTEG